MGMFDYLYSRVPLPECDLPAGTELQTKDLGCFLEHYVIDEAGRLLRCASMADDPLDLAGAEDTRHHGDVRFYTTGAGGELHEFLARFAHGRLERLRRDREGEERWRAYVSKARSPSRGT